MKKNKLLNLEFNKAFTLAETLITLAIIGVVAAITIPVLFNDYQSSAYKQSWRKAYSVFSQAYIQLLSENNLNWTSSVNMKNDFLPYFKVLKDCDVSGSNCWHPTGTIKTLPLADGTQYTMGNWSGSPGLVTLDGMKIIFFDEAATQGWIMIDVNGDKGPNIEGRDVFGLRFKNNKTLPFDEIEMGTCNPPTENAVPYYNQFIGLGCSQYFILNN